MLEDCVISPKLKIPT